jgi:hypothetical protein
MTANLDRIIALLLIYKVKSFRDSYNLTKVLAWKFDIIGFVELINQLIAEELIIAKNINGVNNYEVTGKGKLFLENNLSMATPLILEKYSSEAEFIEPLLR